MIKMVLVQLRSAVKDLEAESQLWPGVTERLTCQVLHIPDRMVAHLKVV